MPKIWIIGAFVCLIMTVVVCVNHIDRLNRRYKEAINNNKAFIQENTGLKDQSRVFRLTIEQLSYYNDSLMNKMNEVREELKIKDREVKNLSYLLSQSSKRDSIVIRDTIFKKSVDIDTIIGDEWYQLRLGLKYPNVIVTEPSFISELYLVTSYKKETINPPKKFFLWRLFQKKHKIFEVNIKEKSPYVEMKKSRFIEIIK